MLGGSFLWEVFSESQPPSVADLVHTTVGGLVWGEAQFRISNMIFDNTKSGLERFLREAAGLVVNPMGGFNRILRGEVAKDFQNPPDRFPGRLFMEMDGGYIHSGGAAAEGTERNQGGVSFLMRYGDPFDGDIRNPFDAFEVQIGLRQPAPVLLTQVDIDGILAAWSLSGDASAGQRFAFFLAANYFNNDPRTFGAQALGARHLLRVPLGKESDRPVLRLRAGARRAGDRAAMSASGAASRRSALPYRASTPRGRPRDLPRTSPSAASSS